MESLGSPSSKQTAFWCPHPANPWFQADCAGMLLPTFHAQVVIKTSALTVGTSWRLPHLPWPLISGSLSSRMLRLKPRSYRKVYQEKRKIKHKLWWYFKFQRKWRTIESFYFYTCCVCMYGYMYIYVNGNHCQFYSSFLDLLKNRELSDYNREC